jgi:hypothetical protein
LSRKKPEAHWVHCELPEAEHVTGDRHCGTGGQVAHVSAANGPPSTRYLPLTHCVHCELVELVQVSGDVQKATAEHCWQVPFAVRKKPAAQLVHTELLAVEHVKESGKQLGMALHCTQVSAAG